MDFPILGNSCQDIHLLITPLQCYYKLHLNKLDVFAYFHERHRIPFHRFQHWAIQVGDDGDVYEVTSFWTPDGKREMAVHTAKEWWSGRKNPPTRDLRIGVTERSSTNLDGVANAIWDVVMADEYEVESRNCQSFALLLKQAIHNEELLTEPKRATLDDTPSCLNPFYVLLHFSQIKQIAIAPKEQLQRWSRAACRRVSGAQRDGTDEQMPGAQNHAALPRRRTSSWLDLMGEETNGQSIEGTNDLRRIIERVNRRRNAEKSSSKQKRSFFSCRLFR